MIILRPLSSVAGGDTPAPLYTILPEKKLDRLKKGDIMASTHVYDLFKKSSSDRVDVALDPDNLDLSNKEGIQQRYDEQLRKETRSRDVAPEEDFSDMVAEHVSKTTVSSGSIGFFYFSRLFQRKRREPESKKSSGSHQKEKKFKF